MVKKKTIIFLLIMLNYIFSFGFLFSLYRNIFNLSYFERSLLYSSVFAMLGSIVYMTRGFYQSVVEIKDENRRFDFDRWIWWYLLRPILGFISGAIVFLITFIAFDLDESFKNQIVFCLAGFLIGFNFHQFIEERINNKINL